MPQSPRPRGRPQWYEGGRISRLIRQRELIELFKSTHGGNCCEAEASLRRVGQKEKP